MAEADSFDKFYSITDLDQIDCGADYSPSYAYGDTMGQYSHCQPGAGIARPYFLFRLTFIFSTS